MVKFTKSAVLKALDEIVEELGGDYIYPEWETGGCTYATVDGEPSCIVGRVIAKIDPDLFEQVKVAETARGASWTATAFVSSEEEFKKEVAYYVNNGSSESYIKQLVPALEAEDGVRAALRAAQSVQDAGMPYATAAREAKTTLTHYKEDN